MLQNKSVILGLRQNAAPVPGIIVRCATTQSVALVRPHAYIRHYSRTTCRKSTAVANIVSNGWILLKCLSKPWTVAGPWNEAAEQNSVNIH